MEKTVTAVIIVFNFNHINIFMTKKKLCKLIVQDFVKSKHKRRHTPASSLSHLI